MAKQKTFLMGCLLGVLAMSCTSEDGPQQAGTGTVSFNVATEASFTTKAVNESEYADLSRYTVEIWQGTDQISSWNYAELPESVEIAAGSYQVKAWYGEDKPASTTGMYVEGKADITVQAEQAEHMVAVYVRYEHGLDLEERHTCPAQLLLGTLAAVDKEEAPLGA